MQSTPTCNCDHANTFGVHFRYWMRSDWFGVLLYWRARTSHDTEADCDRNACTNCDPVPNYRAAPDSTALIWIGLKARPLLRIRYGS
jgi:hypothetical protein